MNSYSKSYQVRSGNRGIKQAKYKNEKTMYSGDVYDSKLEADYAEYLDWMIRLGQVKEAERQYRLDLVVFGSKIASYKIDFKVFHTDGTIELVEVKGFETKDWKMKWKLTQALHKAGELEPGTKLTLVKTVPKLFR